MLPEGKDPADVVAAGETESLVKAIDESVPLLQFRIERELEQHDLVEPEARGRAVRAAAAFIGRHPDSVTRHEYAVFVARRTGVELEVVTRAMGDTRGAEKAERELLRLLLSNHEGVRDLDVSDLFTRSDHRAAYELLRPGLDGLEVGEPPDLGTLLGDDDSDVAVLLRGLAFLDRPLPEPAEVVRKVELAALDRRIEELERVVESSAAGTDEYSNAYAELIALQRERRERQEP